MMRDRKRNTRGARTLQGHMMRHARSSEQRKISPDKSMCCKSGGAGTVYTFKVAGLLLRGTSKPAFLARFGMPRPAAST